MFFVFNWLIIMIGYVVCYLPICCPNFNFIIAKKKKKLNLDMRHFFLGPHIKHFWGCLKNIYNGGIVCQNLDEASPCCGACEMGFGFDLPKCHIMAWLKEPQDIKMIAFHWFPLTIISPFKHCLTLWHLAFQSYG
jgi:hypothetical protein